MSSDLDIVIRLDPGQPVAGAKAVTAEVAKLETQAKKTVDAASGIAKLNFKQAAAGAGQAFALLNEKLKITDSALGNAIGTAVKFGAVGAQIAGPWGAAVGVLGSLGAMLGNELADAFNDSQRDAIKTADAYMALVASIKAENAELEEAAEAYRKVAEARRDADASIGGMARALDESTGKWQKARDAVVSYSMALSDVQDDRRAVLSGPFKDGAGTFRSRQEIELDRSLRDARTTLEGTTSSFGSVAADAKIKADRLKDSLFDLKTAKTAGALSAKQYGDEMRRLGAWTGEAAAKANAYAEAVRRANTPQYDGETPDAISGGEVPGEGYREVDVSSLKPMENKRRTAADAVKDLTDAVKENAEYSKQAAEETAKQAKAAQEAKDAIVTMGDVMANELINASKSLSDNLVTAAQGGKVEWAAWGDQVFDSLTRAIAQALILKAITGTVDGSKGVGGYGGIIGALQSASTGGTIYPSGPGTTDTQTVAFRKRPDETVRIQTPAQEAAYRRGASDGGGGGRTQRVDVQADDSRALLQNFDGPDGDRVMINLVRRNRSAFAALLR